MGMTARKAAGNETSSKPRSTSSRFAVFEPNFGGHRLYYVRRLAADIDSRIQLITTNECLASDAYMSHLSTLVGSGKIDVHLVGSIKEARSSLLANAIDYAGRQERVILVIPEVDALLAALIWYRIRHYRRTLPALRALVTRTPARRTFLPRPVVSGLAKPVLVRLVAALWPKARMFFLTDTFGVVKSRPRYRTLLPVPDPAPELPSANHAESRSQLGIAQDTFVLGLIGVVTAYKYPHIVAQAVAQLPRSFKLLLAGPVENENQELVDSVYEIAGRDRVVRVDGYLAPDELARCFSACDAVILARDTDCPSGALISSVLKGVPVIAAGSPWVCHIVRQLKLGVTAELTPEGLAAAAITLASGDEPKDGSLRSACSRVTSAAFADALCEDERS